MHVLSDDGKVYEGIQLSVDEAEAYKMLDSANLTAHSNAYISHSGAAQLAGWILQKFILVKRNIAPPEPEPTPEASDMDDVIENPEPFVLPDISESI
jgi:hypothetical protein